MNFQSRVPESAGLPQPSALWSQSANTGGAVRKIQNLLERVVRGWLLACIAFSFPLAVGQTTVVSAASYQPVVSPGSIATLFGSNLAPQTASGVPGSGGNYPKQVAGVTVTVGGAAADLFFVSPTQINFVVPVVAQFGTLSVVVAVGAQTTATCTVVVAPTAPAIFTTDAAGTGFGSILNGYTFSSAPFTLTTPTATNSQTSTILAVYGTGFRYAGGAMVGSAPGDVSSHVTAVVTSSSGSSWNLPVLYAGPAPGYEGLDQINVQLVAGLDTSVDTALTISTDAVPSNAVYLWLQQTPAPVVSLVAPSSASPGGTLTMTGSGFLDSSRFQFAARQSVQMTLSDGTKVGVPILSSSPQSVTISVPAYSPTHNGTYYSGPAQVCIAVDAQTSCSPFAFAITAPPPPSEPVGTALLAFVQEAANQSLAALPAGTDPTLEAAISNAAKAQIANLQQIVADANSGTPQTIQVKDLSGNPQLLVMDVAAVQRIEGLLTANSSSNPNSVAARVTAALRSAASRRLMSRNAASATRCNPTESQEIDANNAYGDLQAANEIISLTGLIPFIYSIAQGCADGLAGGVAGCIAGALGVTTIDAGVAYWTEQIATIVADVGLWSIRSSPVFLQALVTSPLSVDLSPAQDAANFEILGTFSPSATAGADLISVVTSDAVNNLVNPLLDLCVPCDLLKLTNASAFQALQDAFTQWTVDQVTDQLSSDTIALAFQNLTNCPSVSVALGGATITSSTNPSASYSISLAGLDQGTSSIELRSSTQLNQQLATFTVSSNLLRADGVPANPTATLGVYISNTPPSLSLDSASYPLGGRIVISGQGFAPNASLSFAVQGGGSSISLVPSLTASGSGTFQQTTFLPNTVGSGSFTLKAIPADGSSPASASFTVQASATAVFVMKSGGLSAASGGALNLGVTQGSNITVTLDGSGSSGGGLSISSWTWTDNDASLSCTTSVCSVSYPAASSTHTIKLIVANSGSQSAPAAGQINLTLQQSAPGPFTVAAAGPSCTGPGPAVTLGWSMSADASAYDIYRNGSLIASNVTGTTYSDSGANVLAGQNYQYLIQAKNSVGTTSSNTLLVPIPANICQSSSALSSLAATPLAVTSGASVTITVSLTGPAPAGGISVSLTSSSSSALPVPTSVPVPAGQTTASATINAGPVPALTTVSVIASYNGVTKSSSVEVSPAAGPQISALAINPTSISSGGSATITVTLSSAAPSGGATVTLTSSDSAVFPVPSTLTIQAGQISSNQTVTAATVAVATSVTVIASIGASSSIAIVTVNPQSSALSISSVSINPSSVTSGGTATITVTLSGPAPSGNALVGLASSAPSAFPPPQTLVVQAGQTSSSTTITTGAVGVSTLVTVTASYGGGTKSATVTVMPSSAIVVSSIVVNPSSVMSGGSATITVTLSGPAPSGGAPVSLVSSDPSAFPPPPMLVVQPGQTSSSTTITVGTVSASTTATVTASYGGATSNVTVTITAPSTNLALSSVSISPSSLSSGAFATLSVSLTGTAPSGGAQVSVQSNNSTAFPAPPTITVPAGQTSNGVSVQAGAVSGSTSVTVTATYGGINRTASVTVNPSTTTQIVVSPTAWQPSFTVGGSSATLGFLISSQTGSALTGSVTASAAWLTVDGHSSENFVAPETVNVTANPAGMQAGTYSANLTITAPSASNSPISVPVTMTILAPLQITTTSLPTGTWGQTYSTQLYATGGAGYVWSLQTGSSLPLNLTLSASGLISGTLVSASSTNTYPLTVVVTDSLNRSQSVNLSLKVQPPIVVTTLAPSSFQFTVGIAYTETPGSSNSISFTASGGTAPYTWAAAGLPNGLAIDASTGYIIGTPTQPGTFPATITASDSTGRTGNGTFNLVAVMNPLVITTATGQTPATLPSGTVGAAYSAVLAATGGTNSGFQWSITGSLPPGLTSSVFSTGCVSTCLQISGVPTQAGTTTFAVTVKDSLNDTTPQTFNLIINAGTPPVIITSTLTLATVGQSYSASFAASGGTPPYQWSFVGSSPDPSLQLTSSGTLQGTSTVPNDCPTGPDYWVGSQPPFGTFTSAYFQVQVIDAASLRQSKQFCLPAYYPTPVVSGFSPSSVVVDGLAKTISINGSNFRNGAYIDGNGFLPFASSFGSSSALSFGLTPSATAAYTVPGGSLLEGARTFWVIQPYSYPSNQNEALNIYDPTPTITSVQAVLNNSSQPCTSNLNCQLVITGTGFVSSTEYQVGANTLGPCISPSTPMPWNTVTTCAFSLPSVGTYTVTVTNGNQLSGGTASATSSVTILH